ncbi:MAG TPA: CehA/McbA family metallohydrolase, partial [Pseudomonadota bacterium]|nr:CehA/McbA family metallohydrolase [Pseudomonadota bacterium]
LDNVEAVFPGAVDDWFHMLNQGFRHTVVAASDSHADVGEEPGAPRTYLRVGHDDPVRVDAAQLVDVIKNQRAVTLSHGPFLTFTVTVPTASGGQTEPVQIGSEVNAPDGKVTVNYRLSAPPWVSVARLHVYVNGRLVQRIPIDPDRNLSDRAERGGPQSGQIPLQLSRDSWIVLEAVGDRPMFPVITGTEEPFLLVSDAVGALAGPLGIAATTDIGAVVVGNPQPYALTNPIWVSTSRAAAWRAPGVVPWKEINVPAQDPGVGVLRTRNHD